MTQEQTNLMRITQEEQKRLNMGRAYRVEMRTLKEMATPYDALDSEELSDGSLAARQGKVLKSYIDGKFGGTENRSYFDENGVLRMTGDATVYDDLSASALTLQKQGTGVDVNAVEACVEYLSSANMSDYMVQSIQLKHSIKLSSPIYPHIHYLQTSPGAPNWLLQYRWQINGGVAVTDWTNHKCATLAFEYISGSINQIAYSLPILAPVGSTLSDIIEFRIVRDTTNATGLFGADPVSGTVRVRSFDIHYMMDSLGSDKEYEK